MRADSDTGISEQLQSARRLLRQGRPDEAQQLVDDILACRTGLPREDVIRSCGLLARLLALRGERVRATMMAALAVELAGCCEINRFRAYAYLDQAHTLRALGDHDQALTSLRRARTLAGHHGSRAGSDWDPCPSSCW